MTFYELIYGLAFISPVLCALAQGGKAGLVGVLVALVVGPGLGACTFLVTRGLFRWVRQHAELGKSKPEGVWLFLMWVLCLAMLAGIGAFGFLGMTATKFIASHVAG